MNLEQRISFIKENILNKGGYGYTIAAKEYLQLIEFTLRELLLRRYSILDETTQRKIREQEKQQAKGRKGKSIQEFTMGQLLGIIRDSDFINAWSKATGKELISIRMINLDELTKLRNPLSHNGIEATEIEARFVFESLRLLIESFEIASLENETLSDLSQLPTLTHLPNPYRGLAAFREEDAAYFFGRTDKIQDLVQLVAKRQFIAILGNSGSGKSSLVFAGLVPQLRQTKQWLIVDCRPKKQPLRELAAALIDALYQTEPNEVARLNEITALEHSLEQQQINLKSIIQRIFDKHSNYSYFLLIIDQFEELYTLAPAEIQPIFLNLLLALIASQVATVLITLRADFLGYALEHAEFAKLLDSYRNKMLGNLNEVGLADAIKQPVHAFNVKFEEGLAERIIRDVGIQAGSLPLLQFTLQQLWERREQNQLTLASYEKLGTVTQALAHYAEQVYHYFSEEGQIQSRQLFVQMIRPGEGTEDTRQVMVLPRDSAKHEIVRQLADKRLVITRHDEQTAENTVEIIHEALIRHWQRLRDWMKEDRSFRVWQENLRGYMKDKVLLRDAQLVVAQEWLEKRMTELPTEERTFIQASFADWKQQVRNHKRVQTIGMAMVLLIIVLAGIGWWLAISLSNREAEVLNRLNDALKENEKLLECKAELHDLSNSD